MIRCPSCLTWHKELDSRQPVSTAGRKAYWDDDPVCGCKACGKQHREEEDEDWIQGEPCEECNNPTTHEYHCDEHQEIAA